MEQILFDTAPLIDQINFWLPIFIGIFAYVVGATVAFVIARYVGEMIMRAFVRSSLPFGLGETSLQIIDARKERREARRG
jgi:membrane protein DedA with SNARE-associated domain